MLIRCKKCEFEDKPENFNLISELSEDSSYVFFYVQCPACDHIEFFQHISVDCMIKMLRNSNIQCVSSSHLFAVSIEESKGDPELAYKLMLKKIRDFKRKYGRKAESVV